MTTRATAERLEGLIAKHAEIDARHNAGPTPETNTELAAITKELTDAKSAYLTSKSGSSAAAEAAALLKDIQGYGSQADTDLATKSATVDAKGRKVEGGSWGRQFVQNDAIQAWLKSGGNGPSPAIEMKTGPVISSRPATGNSTAPDHLDAGGLNPILRLADVDLRQRRMYKWTDMMSTTPVSQGSFQWLQRLDDRIGGDAAETAEAALKPETAGFEYVLKTGTVQNIAVWMDATKQVLEDVPQMESMITTKLPDKVRNRINTQVASGDGVGSNLLGLLPRAIPTHAIGTDPLFIAVQKAIQEIELAGSATEDEQLFTVNALVMNPTTWYSDSFVTARDTTGRFILVDPTQRIDQTSAWGLPVVLSKKITAGKVLVADMTAATLYTREDVVIDVTNSDADKFRRNIITFRAEARVGFEVQSLAAFRMVQ